MQKLEINYSTNYTNDLEETLMNNPKTIMDSINCKSNEKRSNELMNYALAVSGINNEELKNYYNQLNKIYDSIICLVDLNNDYTKMSSLNKIIYQNFKHKSHFPELSNIIDTRKGNCIAFATLYSIFALKTGLDVELATSNEGIHFLNKFNINNKTYYVDCNIEIPSGDELVFTYFNKNAYKMKLMDAIFGITQNAKLSDLLSAIYRSRAHKEENIKKSIELYKKSLLLNPSDKLVKNYLKKLKLTQIFQNTKNKTKF